jgi:hypothetical protein
MYIIVASVCITNLLKVLVANNALVLYWRQSEKTGYAPERKSGDD